MCLSPDGILSAGESFSSGFSNSAPEPIDRNRIGPWGGDGAEGMGCREMSAELRADVLQCLGNSIQQKGMRRED